MLAEQHDEWTEGRRYLGLDVLARSRMTIVTEPDADPDATTSTTPPALTTGAKEVTAA